MEGGRWVSVMVASKFEFCPIVKLVGAVFGRAGGSRSWAVRRGKSGEMIVCNRCCSKANIQMWIIRAFFCAFIDLLSAIFWYYQPLGGRRMKNRNFYILFMPRSQCAAKAWEYYSLIRRQIYKEARLSSTIFEISTMSISPGYLMRTARW